MKRLIIAEFRKIKRMKMTYAGYISILCGVFISILQINTISNNVTFERLIDNSLYNNIILFLPFPLTLIGGYIIDREYVQDTQKNMLVVPIRWCDAVKAKIVIMLFVSIWLSLFSSVVLIIAGISVKCTGMTITNIFRMITSNLISHICVLIGVLPIILWFSKMKGKYIWGSFLSLLLGVSGVFVASGKAMNWHPITACFSFVSCDMINTSVLNMRSSGIAMAVYMFLSLVIYIVRYGKQKC